MKVWSYVGSLSPKDKTQLEERLRRVAGPSTPDKREFGKDALTPQPSQISRLTGGIARPASPSSSLPRVGGIPRSGSPPTGGSPDGYNLRPQDQHPQGRLKLANQHHTSQVPHHRLLVVKACCPLASLLREAEPERFALPSCRQLTLLRPTQIQMERRIQTDRAPKSNLGGAQRPPGTLRPLRIPQVVSTLTISKHLEQRFGSQCRCSQEDSKESSSLVQILGPSSPLQYRDLAEHTEGLLETVTLQMAHAFDKPDNNVRLAKHLIQTLNAFCDNPLLAESLTVDILTALFEELAPCVFYRLTIVKTRKSKTCLGLST